MKYNEVCLADVCDLIAGYAFKSKDFGDFDDKVIKITHITPPIVDMNGLSGVDFSKYNREKLKRYIAKSGDYVLAMTGATIGKIGRIVSGEAYINQRVLLFKNKDAIDKDFLYYVLLQHDFEQYVYNHIDSESAQPNISATTIGKYIFSLPPMSIQQKIGRLLRSLDEKCEVNNAINHNLEQQARAIYREWFVDFAPNGGIMPTDWKLGRLKDILRLKRNAIRVGDEPLLPYLPIDVIPMNTFALTEFRPNEEAQSSLITFDTDDIVIGAMRVYFHRVVLAPCRGITRTTCFVLAPHDSDYFAFGLLCCDQNSTIDYAQTTSKGSTMPYAVWDGGLGDMEIVIPPREIAQKFNDIIKPMLRQIQASYFENLNLRNMRDSLLPKLMSGEIDVSEVEV